MNIEKHLLQIQETLTEITTALKLRLPEKELYSYAEAMVYLDRRRSWIQRRLVTEVVPNLDAVLIKDVDWLRRGNKIYFKKSGLDRLLQAIEN